MRIGIDVSQTGKMKAGCGYVAYSLAQALSEIDAQDEFILYPTFGDVYLDPEWNKETLRIERPNFRRGLGHPNLERARSFWRNPPPDFEAQLGNPDVVISNNFYCPTGLKKARLIFTVHDLSYLSNPEWTTEENRLACFTGVFNAAIYADYIIAPSRYTLEQFHRAYPHYPPEQAAVLPEASRFTGLPEPALPVETQDFASLPPRRVIGAPAETQDIASLQSRAGGRRPAMAKLKPGGFWLNVGTPEPRKNQIRLLQAYAKFKERHSDAYPLVFAGGNGWMLEQFDHTIDELGLRSNVVRLGYVDDASLGWLYRNCYAFVYPALLEGFGLPVLEAMSLGAATITAAITSMPEIAGDAALQVDPYNEDAILGAMEQLAADEGLRQELKARALERARLFNWQSYARGVLAICETLTNKGEH